MCTTRISVVGHSLIHVRQQLFWKHVSELGHTVLLIGPDEWGAQRMKRVASDAFSTLGLPVVMLRPDGVTQYAYMLSGLYTYLTEFSPDLVYVNQEPESALAEQVAGYSATQHRPFAVFTWENLIPRGTQAQSILGAAALTVCGNQEAEALALPFARGTVVLPQVGVDTDHFQARPGRLRQTAVAYIGRRAPEKGVEDLLTAWPTAKVYGWKPWEALPWFYSEVQVVVCPSRDTEQWHEQAMPYVAVEAMCCGCAVVVSNAGSIPFWMRQYAGSCPGANMVGQGNIDELRSVLTMLTGDQALQSKMSRLGRQWVMEYLSTPVVGKQVANALEAAA